MSIPAGPKAQSTAASQGEGTPVSEAAGPVDRSAFMRLIGATQVPAPQGKVHVRLPHLREELLNQLPAAHGGVIMALLDSVMSRAAGSWMSSSSRRCGRRTCTLPCGAGTCAAPMSRMKALRSTGPAASLTEATSP